MPRRSMLDGRKDLPANIRFELCVDYKGPILKGKGRCWNWLGTLQPKTGRPLISVNGKLIYAYRYSYEAWHGPVPEGMVLLHECDNKICVNPNHVRPGTQLENIADMDRKGRRGKRGPSTKVGKPRRKKPSD